MTVDFGKLTLGQYAQHLIRFHDGRFGRHPRWRFFVFNMIMRERARGSARFYVSKSSDLKNLVGRSLLSCYKWTRIFYLISYGRALN